MAEDGENMGPTVAPHPWPDALVEEVARGLAAVMIAESGDKRPYEAWPEDFRQNMRKLATGALNALPLVELLEALRGMTDAYWRGSEDSDDEHAPSMVKDALAALAKFGEPGE